MVADTQSRKVEQILRLSLEREEPRGRERLLWLREVKAWVE
jgi:hypothetical protein